LLTKARLSLSVITVGLGNLAKVPAGKVSV
jgi:hypothetical protein